MQNENNKQASVIAASDLQRQVGTVIRRVAKYGEHLVVERDGGVGTVQDDLEGAATGVLRGIPVRNINIRKAEGILVEIIIALRLVVRAQEIKVCGKTGYIIVYASGIGDHGEGRGQLPVIHKGKIAVRPNPHLIHLVPIELEISANGFGPDNIIIAQAGNRVADLRYVKPGVGGPARLVAVFPDIAIGIRASLVGK